MRVAELDRFWAKVDKTETCWLWMAQLNGNGYGKFWANGTKVYAHRFAYEQFVGPILNGSEIDHLCRLRHCVNPTHLESVDRRTNILRSENFAAIEARRTECPYGHSYDEANTYWRKGKRKCRACNRRNVTACRLVSAEQYNAQRREVRKKKNGGLDGRWLRWHPEALLTGSYAAFLSRAERAANEAKHQ